MGSDEPLLSEVDYLNLGDEHCRACNAVSCLPCMSLSCTPLITSGKSSHSQYSYSAHTLCM